MAKYANDWKDFLARQSGAPTNLGSSRPVAIESPVPRPPFPEGPALKNGAPSAPVPRPTAPAYTDLYQGPKPTNLGTSEPSQPATLFRGKQPLTGPTLRNIAPATPPGQVPATPAATPVLEGEFISKTANPLVPVPDSLRARPAASWFRPNTVYGGYDAPKLSAPTPPPAGPTGPIRSYMQGNYDAIPTPKAGINPTAGAIGAGLMLAPDAWRTGAEIKDKTAAGQGFWSAVGDTINSNLNRSLRSTVPDAVAVQEGLRSTPAGEPFDPRAAVQALARAQSTPMSPIPSFSDSNVREPPSQLEVAAPAARDLRGGFVGAATDAQAAKALQDRAAQNAAAQFNIDGMNRAAEAERDTRAARLGVSRGVLDRMEGRDSAAAAADSAAQGAIPDRWNNPFSMPGDSFQDTRGRQADFERLRDQAVSGNRRQRSEAAIGLNSLMGLLERNQAREQIAADARTGQARLADERLRMLLGQQEHAVDNARADRSVALQEKQFQAAQEQNQFNREHTAAQFLQSERKDRTQLGQDEVKRVEDTYAKFAAETKNAVNPAQLMDFGRSLLGRSNLNAMSPEMAQRIRDGSPTLEDLHRLRSLQASSNDYWFFRPTEQDVVNKYYKQ